MAEKALIDSVVFVIDDDVTVHTALEQLLGSVGLRVVSFVSAAEFLAHNLPDSPSCLVLDVRMPGMSGLKLQEELAKAEVQLPIVFITGHPDVAVAVRAMKAGASDFLIKPFTDQDLLDAVFVALERDRERRARQESLAELHEQFDSLSPREREVLMQVAAGKMNKHIAAELGVSEVMVKVHRANGMRKLHAKSVVELVRKIDRVRTNTL
jgi:FixJ family two-component response regulator